MQCIRVLGLSETICPYRRYTITIKVAQPHTSVEEKRGVMLLLFVHEKRYDAKTEYIFVLMIMLVFLLIKSQKNQKEPVFWPYRAENFVIGDIQRSSHWRLRFFSPISAYEIEKMTM